MERLEHQEDRCPPDSLEHNPEEFRRPTNRLFGYDYSQNGGYFVTLILQNRSCLFGKVVDGVMRLNDAGQMVAAEWLSMYTRFPTVELDEYVVMPNHFHGILILADVATQSDDRAPPVGTSLAGGRSVQAKSPGGFQGERGATTRDCPYDGGSCGDEQIVDISSLWKIRNREYGVRGLK